MPINRWRRLRDETFRTGNKSPSWGIVDLIGKFSNVIIHRVLRSVAASRNGPPVRSFEEPLILEVPFDGKTILMHQLVMPRTEQHQVIQTGLAAG